MADKASNWELCYKARLLANIPGIYIEPPRKEVLDQGKACEDVVAKAHPEWSTSQKTYPLPTGRKCRVDFLDELGGPVEVKGQSDKWFRNFNTIADYMNAPFKYQVQYLVQLSAYCVVTQKDGRFILVNRDVKDEKGVNLMKEIPITLDEATVIYDTFLEGSIPVPSCAFCNVRQACTAMKACAQKVEANVLAAV